MLSITLEPKNKTKPLRAGDVIAYNHPLYIGGSKEGYHEATVLEIDNANIKKLTLSTSDYLTPGTYIKRIKINVKGKQEYHPGIYQTIDEYILESGVIESKIEKRE